MRLRKVLVEFGFGSTLPDEPIFTESTVIMLGKAPMRIGLLTKISGTSFDDVAAAARFYELDGLKIPVISPELLLKNKLASGLGQDLVDAAALQRWLKIHGTDEVD